jgi:hypothetical protein
MDAWQVDPISEPRPGECLNAMDFAVRVTIHVELLSFLEARNPFLIGHVGQSILAGMLEASDLTGDQILAFHVESVTEVPLLGSAAIQFIFRFVPHSHARRTVLCLVANQTIKTEKGLLNDGRCPHSRSVRCSPRYKLHSC